MAVPSSYNRVTEAELQARGVNIVIYANQLLRSASIKNCSCASEIIVRDAAAPTPWSDRPSSLVSSMMSSAKLP